MLTLASTGRRFRRVARTLTALCVLTMLGSNALAATGLCLIKTPPASPAVTTANEAPCVLHGEEGRTRSSHDAGARHCPQDDPGAQLRAGDVPAASIMPAITNPLRIILGDVAVVLLNPRALEDAPPTPLYARLSRLLL
jgi:hypothetical protein